MGKEGVTRVVILGGGFGGVFATHHLDRLTRKNPRVEVTLISRDNFYLMTPLLFEASSGVLDPRHVVNPIRPMLKTARFVEAEVEGVDFEKRVVRARQGAGDAPWEFAYDHLVVALGGVSNRGLIPGSEHAMTFKSLTDAIVLRNHVLDIFERAEVESDAARKRELLTFVVIGGGLVGVELMGELHEFVSDLRKTYRRIAPGEPRFLLLDSGNHIVEEMPEDLGEYAQKNFARRGIEIRHDTRVPKIEAGLVYLPRGEPIASRTILLATGVTTSPLVGAFPLEKSRKGRIVTDAAMRCPARPEVWALGDCAAVPDPSGHPYPTLAQHALRQAKLLARNILAAIEGRPARPFVYQSKGMLAMLGRFAGIGKVWKLKLRGFLAWFVWRTYYLFQMPRRRRLRVVIDWTLELFLGHDTVKIDLFGEENEARRSERADRLGQGGTPVAPEMPGASPPGSTASSPPAGQEGEGNPPHIGHGLEK